jgi:hypothetical protein
MGLGDQRQALAALPPGKTRYPLYRRLGGPQDRSGRVWKISPPRGFDPLTFQPVASRCTDCAIPAHETSLPPSGIRTPNPSKRAAADRRLRPRGDRDRRFFCAMSYKHILETRK